MYITEILHFLESCAILYKRGDSMQQRGKGIFLHKTASSTPDSMVRLHAHDAHELYFLVSGQRRYFIGHRIYDVSPGNLVIIPKNELHRTTSPGTVGYDRYVLFVDDENLRPLAQNLGEEAFSALMDSGCIQLPPNAANQILTDMEQIEQENDLSSPYTQAFANHMVYDILLCALRYGKKKEICASESADKIQDVARYISKHFDMPLSLQDAAAMVYMEQTYFSKRFKQLTGFGFQEYLTQTRLRAAELLLESTDLSMGEIAEQCGFTSSNYFGDVFRRWKGVSPSAYRSVNRE